MVVDGDGQQTLNYPIPNSAALEPPQEWARLRQQCPVAPVTLPSGDQASLVTRYEDVKRVLSDSRFTRPTRGDGAARVSANESGGPFSSEMAETLPQSGDAHRQWRQTVGRWFTAKRMKALRPEIEAMADQLVDDMVRRGHPADLKASLGFPVPVWVICKILGVPDSDRDKFAYWSDAQLSMTHYTQTEIDAAQDEFVDYLSAHIDAKRAAPGDDLLSTLVTDTGMSTKQLVATGQALLVAGHETTANMIGKMVAMLLADRSRWERLVADPSLARTAVEEVLRFDANLGFGMLRYLDAETEVAETTLPAGTTVVCSMSAANRDETAFDDADRLAPERSPNPHLTFGSGAHSCLGQALARTELHTVLEVLLRRLPSLELAVDEDELRRIEGLVVGGLREVPVRWW